MPETTAEHARGVWVNLLLPALERLSWDGVRQIAWLDEHRISEDELALDFDHAFSCRWILRDHGWISPEAEELLQQIDTAFNEMTASRSGWSDDAILHGQAWGSIRHLAIQTLEAVSDAST